MAVKRKSKAERMKLVKNVIANINKKEKENVINFASEEEMAERLRIEFIPTVSFALNNAFSGLPRGKMSLVAGSSDCGKTSFLLETIGYNMQIDPDFIACWIESEDSLSDELINLFNIDRNRFIVYNVDPDQGGEVALDYCCAVAQTGVDLIVINSLKCLTPKKEMTDSMLDANIALQARLNAKFIRKVIPLISKSGSALACVQHKATNINAYGAPQEITGGQAIRYNNMLTLDFNKVSIKAGDPYYDIKDQCLRIRVRVLKNHCCATKNPYTVTDYTVRLGKGTDTTGEILEEAYRQEIIVKAAGGYFREYLKGMPHDKENIRVLADGTKCEWRGAANFQTYLDSHPEYFEYIKEQVESGEFNVEYIDEDEVTLLEAGNKQQDELINEVEAILDNVFEEEEE